MNPDEMIDENKETYSTQEAARLLKISRNTVQNWVDNGKLLAWKTAGGHRRLDGDSVRRVLQEQRVALGKQNLNQTPFTLLIVDDDPMYRELLQVRLQKSLPQAVILSANDGFEGLVKLGQHKPHVLITDLNMPGMDGFQMLSSLAQNSDATLERIFAITSLNELDIAKRGGLPNNVQVFFKPVDFIALLSAITSVREQCAHIA